MHAHDHSGDRRRLAIALALILALMSVEVAGGILAHSVALLADAGHNFGDVVGLLLAWGAHGLSGRRPTRRYTYGFGSASILAALLNAIILLMATGAIAWEAVHRLLAPTEVAGLTVMVVALIGIVINGVSAWLLMAGSKSDLNVRGAFLHIATDLAAFAGTAVAGAVILATGWNRADPLASLGVAALIFWSSFLLLRESTRILLDVAPQEPADVAQAMLELPKVSQVHDLHVWTVGSGFPSVSAHVLVEPGADCHAIRRDLAVLLAERYGLSHSTLQVEHAHTTAAGAGHLPLVTPPGRRTASK